MANKNHYLLNEIIITLNNSNSIRKERIVSARPKVTFDPEVEANERVLIENDADTCYNKAASYLRSEHTKEALVFYLDALEKYKRVYPKNDSIKIGNCLMYAGVCYSNLADYDNELEFKLNALGVFQSLNLKDDVSMAFCLNNVGIGIIFCLKAYPLQKLICNHGYFFDELKHMATKTTSLIV